jgi:hypothetical protein
MKILIACEESQTVAKAFRQRGHEAWSCDTEPPSGGHPEWHLQCDVRLALEEQWDMIIAFPPCTYLCASGMHWTTRGLRDPQLTTDAIRFVKIFWEADCPKIAIENPIGALSKAIRKPDQIIQPWMFGEDASKSTCLWLKNLQPLTPTQIIPPKGYWYADREWAEGYDYVKINGYRFGTVKGHTGKPTWGNQTPSGQNKLGPSPERAKLRSKTYPGIAEAMAEHWG